MTGMAAGENRCPACGQPSCLVWVHGHGQCTSCGQNVAPCCSGAGDEVDAREPAMVSGQQEVLLDLLRTDGATLRATLLNRFAARTGCPLDLGDRAIEAALASGRIHFDRSTGVIELAS